MGWNCLWYKTGKFCKCKTLNANHWMDEVLNSRKKTKIKVGFQI